MPKVSYSTIPEDALIDIKVSGQFHRRLITLITLLGETVSLDEFKAVLESIKENKPSDKLFEFNVHTILMLIYEIETEAKKQNKLTTAEIEVPEEESTGN